MEEIKASFTERRKIAIEGMESVKGIKTNHPKGVFYLFPEIKSFGMDSMTFCNRLLDEAGVVCVPGNAFGDCGEGYMRLSYSTEKNQLLLAIDRIAKFCEEIICNT